MALTSSRWGNAISGIIVGILVIISGVILGAHYYSLAAKDHRILAEGVKTVGTVTDIQFDIRSNKKNHSEKTVTVSYTTQNGEDHEVDSTTRYNMSREGSTQNVEDQLLNQEKTVFYDPDNTSNAVVEGWQEKYSHSYVPGGFFIAMGVLAIGISAYSLSENRATANPVPAKSIKDSSQ